MNICIISFGTQVNHIETATYYNCICVKGDIPGNLFEQVSHNHQNQCSALFHRMDIQGTCFHNPGTVINSSSLEHCLRKCFSKRLLAGIRVKMFWYYNFGQRMASHSIQGNFAVNYVAM